MKKLFNKKKLIVELISNFKKCVNSRIHKLPY